MDEKTRAALNEMADAHDKLVIRVAALTALLGAVFESQSAPRPRVDAWCRAIADHSDPVIGADYVSVRDIAYDILRGIEPEPKDRKRGPA